MKKALVHIAEKEAKKDISAVLLEAVLMLLSDRGVSLDENCPEYRVLEAAAGSANATLADLMDKAIPIARQKAQNWATEYAEARFIRTWAKVQEIDDPKLYNDAYELFSDPKRTPREKIRAMEFRMESYLRSKAAS